MDNNFVSIDDLVRQRLGGGEEQERSGAWLHMRDLLDKEMPQENQKRAGFIYWRRMLSAMAVLLLIASITVGGYELSAHRNGSNAGNTDVTLPATVAKTTIASSTSGEISKTPLSSTGINDNNQPKNDNQGNTHKQSDKKLIAANTNEPKNKVNKAAVRANTDRKINNAGENNDQLPVAKNVTDSKEVSDVPVAKNTVAKNVVGKERTDKKDVAKNAAPVAKGESGKTVAGDGSVASIAKTPNNTPGNDKKAEKTVSHDVAADIATGDKPSAKDVAAIKSKPNKKIATTGTNGNAKHNNDRVEKMEALALSSHLTSVSSPKLNTVAQPVPGAVATEKDNNNNKAGSSNVKVPAKKSAVLATPNKVVSSKETAAKDVKSSSKVAAATASPSADKDVKSIAANTPKAAPVASAPAVAENAAMKNAYALNTKKGKKVIRKLVLYEHYFKANPSDEHYNLDTISMETLTEELGGEDNPYIPCPKKSAAKEVPGSTPAGVSSEVASTSSSANTMIMPAASASSGNKTALGTKENAASKQSVGGAALEGLSSAFNDIKYNVKGMQFAPGLTAGINGTFFGPSSFKGFEFGVTGDFIFGNDWSFSTELKYFHRINNNYTLNDNYYTYTPQGNGYSKQEMTNSYNFSTLHSIEMPLIVRYSFGKFNFFVGGNLVYSFAINEGGLLAQPVNAPATTTATQGNDNNPKLAANDFDSRFGLGCLFGLSYKVAPNVTLDLRNVETVWDNAKTPGAKYLSDQLYKSPSLQLSLGYRLGGHKSKD